MFDWFKWTYSGPAFWFATLGVVAVAAAALAFLHGAPNQVKRVVVVTCTFLGGAFYFLEFVIPPNPETQEAWLAGWNLTTTAGTVGNAVQVVAGFTFLLGVYNLARIHGNNIRRVKPDWPYSLAFFLAFLAMTVFAFWRDVPGAPPWVKDPDETRLFAQDAFTVLFKGLWQNLESTMFSILAFYIVSAAYRAFRIRSGEAALLMITALVLMMGQVPLGMAMTAWIPEKAPGQEVGWFLFRIESLSQYVLTAINSPVQRAMGFGLGLGALAMALRIWLSLERGTYFSQEN
jgi:hypothetical protein